jgi:Zn-dependent protease
MGGATAIYSATIWIIPIILAITLHEAAHGYAALRFGDDTALRAGRVSLNPLRHVDPLGTILIPGLLLLSGAPFLFGYAKPVPVNFWRLNHPKRDMVWVAVAGPGMNIALAAISGALLHGVPFLPPFLSNWATDNLVNSIQINAVLAVFNMLPLPPLDGGRVAVGLLPRPLALPLARIERWGLGIVIGLLFILPWVGDKLGLDLNLVPWLLGRPVMYLIWLIATLTGLT